MIGPVGGRGGSGIPGLPPGVPPELLPRLLPQLLPLPDTAGAATADAGSALPQLPARSPADLRGRTPVPGRAVWWEPSGHAAALDVEGPDAPVHAARHTRPGAPPHAGAEHVLPGEPDAGLPQSSATVSHEPPLPVLASLAALAGGLAPSSARAPLVRATEDHATPGSARAEAWARDGGRRARVAWDAARAARDRRRARVATIAALALLLAAFRATSAHHHWLASALLTAAALAGLAAWWWRAEARAAADAR